ncbi:MAG TPA: PmoA family protein [Planctomycetota bacterium]
MPASRRALVRGAGLAAALFALAACAAPGITARLEHDVAHVTIGGAPFASVHLAAQPRPYVFPILGPDGVMMTRSFPMAEVAGEERDHPHHQSLWFAHGSVNGFDFWVGKAHRERLEWNGVCDIDNEPTRCRLRCGYRWLADGDTLVCTEERELVFAGGDARTIDVSVTLRPGSQPLVLGDTKEGTFALRVHPALCVESKTATGKLVNSEGQQNRDVWGKKARWIDDSGTVEGKQVGVAMFDHPANHGYPTWWHARTYGLLAANPFGVHDFEGKPAGTGNVTVPVGGRLTLRYRVLLHGSGWDQQRLEAAWQAWSTGQPATPTQ